MNAVATREAKKIRVDVSGRGTLLYGPGAHLGVTDMRWAPTLLQSHEHNNSKNKFPVIEVTKILMNEQLRDKLANEYRTNEEGIVPFFLDGSVEDFLGSVNIALCLLDHHGFDADYDPEFLAKFEPIMGHLFLHGFKVEGSGEPIAKRHFHGVTYEREDFKQKLNDMFGRYGI